MNKQNINTNNLLVKIDLVEPNNYNPKIDFRGDENNAKEFEKVKDSLKTYGQVQPLIVREIDGGKYEIINGFHRFEAMKELGYNEIEVKNLGNIDFDTAVAIALQTEDTKIPIDNVELAGLMRDIVNDEKPISYWAELLPYSEEVIKSKIDLINFDFSQYDETGEGANLANLSYAFKFSDEAELAKIKDYFEQFPKDERGEALIRLLD